MSTDDSFSIGGMNLKEWSFIILMICLIIVVMAFAVVFIIAVLNTPVITLTGSIDLAQITTVVFGIALIATVLVSQKLTSNAVSAAVRATDEVWMKDK